MKKNIAFTLCMFFLIKCDSNADNSLDLLSDSFFVWYYKNHPVISTLHNNGDFHNILKKNDFKSNEQYLVDLNRFFFELTQINMQKLSAINKVKYKRIERSILKLLYLNEDLNEQDWRPSLKLEEVERGMEYLVNYNYIGNDRLNAISGRLSDLEEILDNILTNTSFLSSKEYFNCNRKIKSIIRILNNMEVSLDYKDDTYLYSLIIKLSNKLSAKLKKFSNKLDSMQKIFSNSKHSKSLDVNNESLMIMTESEVSINELYNKVKKEIKNEQVKLFNNCFPTFLKDNDEPVWVDYEDTLNVIQSVIYDIQNNYRIEDFKYVPDSYNNISESGYDLDVKFNFYNTSYDFLYIDEDIELITPINKMVYINLPAIDISSTFNFKSKSHYFNKIQIDLLNAFKIYPGAAYIRSLESDKIINQLPNKTTLKGLQRYAERIFIKTNKNASVKHQILHQKNVIKDMCRCLIDIEYNVNSMRDKEIEEYLTYNCFLDGLELEQEILKLKNNYFGLSSMNFIGYHKILELENLYIEDFDKDYFQFYNTMLENGIVDLENLDIPFN